MLCCKFFIGQYLKGIKKIDILVLCKSIDFECIFIIKGVQGNNLKLVDFYLLVGLMICIIGVFGLGKLILINGIFFLLVVILLNGVIIYKVVFYMFIEGFDYFDKVVDID